MTYFMGQQATVNSLGLGKPLVVSVKGYLIRIHLTQLCKIAPPFILMMVSALMFRHNIYTCGSDLEADALVTRMKVLWQIVRTLQILTFRQ